MFEEVGKLLITERLQDGGLVEVLEIGFVLGDVLLQRELAPLVGTALGCVEGLANRAHDELIELFLGLGELAGDARSFPAGIGEIALDGGLHHAGVFVVGHGRRLEVLFELFGDGFEQDVRSHAEDLGFVPALPMALGIAADEVQIELFAVIALPCRRIAVGSALALHDVPSKRELLLGTHPHFASARLLNDEPFCLRHHRLELEVIERSQIFLIQSPLHALAQHSVVERVMEDSHQRRACDGVGVGRDVAVVVLVLHSARYAHRLDPRQNLTVGLPLYTHVPDTPHNRIELVVRLVVAVCIAVVAPLVAADGFSRFEVRLMAARNVGREFVRILLGDRKHDAEHHFPRRSVLEVVSAELQIAEFVGINEVNDDARFQHVAAQSVGMPTDDAINLAFANEREHPVEDRAVVGFLGRRALGKDVARCDADTALLGQLLAELQLVGDGFVLLSRFLVRRTPCIDAVALGGQWFVLCVLHAPILPLYHSSSDTFPYLRM